MPEPSDPNLDDLKRRARRRLVGAVVLALAAAVFVPMLLESEQKPLGDDVSVRIPPVDDGKFVNQLNAPAKAPAGAVTAPAKPEPGKPEPAKPVAPKAEADKPEPAKADVASADPTPSPAAATPMVVAAAAPAAPATTPAAPRKSLADAEQRVLGANAAPKSAPAATKSAAPEAKAAAAPAPKAATTTTSGSFVVQLAAFSDDKGANSLANKLKKAGYPSFTEPVATSHGTLWRVRVGPYGARDDANGARDKLKRDGYNGLVAANPRTP